MLLTSSFLPKLHSRLQAGAATRRHSMRCLVLSSLACRVCCIHSLADSVCDHRPQIPNLIRTLLSQMPTIANPCFEQTAQWSTLAFKPEGRFGKKTSVAIPARNRPSWLSRRTLTPNTCLMRSSIV